MKLNFNKSISSLIVFSKTPQIRRHLASSSSPPIPQLYVNEYGELLSLSLRIQSHAKKIHNILHNKNIDGRNEHILSLVSLIISNELYNSSHNGVINKFMKHDLTRFIVSDLYQIYNQCVSVIRNEKLDKRVSYVVVRWSFVFKMYLRDFEQEMMQLKFFWFLFLAIYDDLEGSAEDLMVVYDVYKNYLFFVNHDILKIDKRKVPDRDIDELEFVFTRKYYKEIQRIYKEYGLVNPLFNLNQAFTFLEKKLPENNDVMFIRKLFVDNNDLIGEDYHLTTVKFVNIYNLVKDKYPDTALDMIVNNYYLLKNNVGVELGQISKYIPREYFDKEKNYYMANNLFFYVLERIFGSESQRLGNKFNKDSLLTNVSFMKSISACVLMTIMFTIGNFKKLKVKLILKTTGVSFLELGKIIEIFLKELPFLDSSVKRYFKYIEQRVYSFFIWKNLDWIKTVNNNDILKRKIYQIIYQRYNDLCYLFNLSEKEDMVNLFKIIYWCLENRLMLFKDRHMDQMVMCGIYVYCNKVKKFTVQFKDIMLNYKFLCQNVLSISPIEINKTLFSISVNDDHDEVEKMKKRRKGESVNGNDDDDPDRRRRFEEGKCDIVYFYNHIFVNYIKDIVFNLDDISVPDDFNLEHEERNVIIMTPRRRRRLENTNFYISSRIISPQRLSPKTKKLYSFGKYSIIKSIDKDLNGNDKNNGKKGSDDGLSSSASSSSTSTTSSQSSSSESDYDNGHSFNQNIPNATTTTSSSSDDDINNVSKRLFV